MSNIANNANSLQPSNRLLLLTTRLTIGGAVCFTEGLVSSIGVVLPKNDNFFIVIAILALCAWLAFFRFRDNKLGADIGDLCFYEVVLHVIEMIGYFNGIDASALWYVATGIFALKIIRVYMSNSSVTQQQGWGRFGPMTWFHAKYHEPRKPIPFNTRLQKEIIGAVIGAAVASVIIRLLPDLGRVAVTWIVPFSFEFLYGPMQLRNLKIFNNLLSDSNKREAELAMEIKELAAENQKLKQFQETLMEDPNSPNKPLAKFYELYSQMSPAMQKHIMIYAENAAIKFPAKKDEPKS